MSGEKGEQRSSRRELVSDSVTYRQVISRSSLGKRKEYGGKAPDHALIIVRNRSVLGEPSLDYLTGYGKVRASQTQKRREIMTRNMMYHSSTNENQKESRKNANGPKNSQGVWPGVERNRELSGKERWGQYRGHFN